jgi:hypothetical protein
VQVHALPPLRLIGPSIICQGQIANLFVSGAISYSWSNGATTPMVSVSPLSSAVYSVSGTDNHGCSKTISHSLTVNPLPTITVNSGVICPGYSFVMVPSGAQNYSYSSGSATVAPLFNSTYSVNGSGANGCISDIAAVSSVSVVNSLTVGISGNSTICKGQPALLNANGASTYTWSTGQTGQNISPSPNTSTSYSVTGGTGTCSSSAMIIVNVNPLPVIACIASPSAICVGERANITAIGAQTYTWSNTSQTLQTISVNPSSTTNYTITGVDQNLCEGSAKVNLYVNECTGIASSDTGSLSDRLFPNPSRGTFVVEVAGNQQARIEIYNALGQKILTSELNPGVNNIRLKPDAGIYLYSILKQNERAMSGKLIIE